MTKYSEAFKAMIVDLANGGAKPSELKSKYSVSEAAIYKYKWKIFI